MNNLLYLEIIYMKTNILYICSILKDILIRFSQENTLYKDTQFIRNLLHHLLVAPFEQLLPILSSWIKFGHSQ